MTQRWSVFAGDRFFGVYEARSRTGAIQRVCADMGYRDARHAASVLEIPVAKYLARFRVYEVQS